MFGILKDKNILLTHYYGYGGWSTAVYCCVCKTPRSRAWVSRGGNGCYQWIGTVWLWKQVTIIRGVEISWINFRTVMAWISCELNQLTGLTENLASTTVFAFRNNNMNKVPASERSLFLYTKPYLTDWIRLCRYDSTHVLNKWHTLPLAKDSLAQTNKFKDQ